MRVNFFPLQAAAAVMMVVLCAGKCAAREYYVDARAASAVSDGSLQAPFRTISEAAKVADAGDVVLIETGVYRETVIVKNSGTADKPLVFQAAPGAHVVVTGADRLNAWTREPGTDPIFSADWPYSFPLPNGSSNAVVGRCEQVFVDGYLLHQVLDGAHMSMGSFCADTDGKRLYVWGPRNQDLSKGQVDVEASVRPDAFRCPGSYIVVRGLIFRYAANPPQRGALVFDGSNNAAENCLIERVNGAGASFVGPDHRAVDCIFRENGQLGFTAFKADRLKLLRCLVQDNNVKGYPRDWEAGGDKITLSRGVEIADCRFIENRGTGLWFDLGDEDSDVHNCLFDSNEDSGLFYEISFGLHFHDNVVVGNGFLAGPGGWGAWAGLCLSSSPNCVIERNLIVGNREGFDFREQARTTPRIGHKGPEQPVWNHDEIIRNNLFAYNADAQIWGWFDVADARIWPAAMQAAQERPGNGARPEADIAADYQAKPGTAQPTGLTLEKLNIRFAGNVYTLDASDGFFNWGMPGGQHAFYRSLPDVQRDLSFDSGSVIAASDFRDPITKDFRLPAQSAAERLQAYPRGEVPGVALGTTPR